MCAPDFVGLAVGLSPVLFLIGVLSSVSIPYRKIGAVQLIVAGLLWLWALQGEKGGWSLLGWLGLLVSIAGLLVYIEAVKRDIVKTLGGPLHSENEGD